jgi:hypothetical protein
MPVAAARAQQPVPRTASVSGVVHDSVSRMPLAGATVQIVSAEDPSRIAFVTLSDSLGRYALSDVPHGRYWVGFFHPLLDSLGLEAPARAFRLAESTGGELRVDLGLPSPVRIHEALCANARDSTVTSSDTTGALVGFVLDAQTLTSAPHATVIAEWMELTVGAAGVRHRVPRRDTHTDASGWFVLCGIPAGTDVLVRAANARDTSGAIELRVPVTRLVRRNLFVGRSVAQSTPPDSVQSDSSRARASRTPVARRGDGALTGWVRTENGQPIAGARVKVVGSAVEGTTNANGEFSVAGLPSGTQSVETRAMGYFPDTRAVDVTRERVPVLIGLTTLKHVLDTMHVRATALTVKDLFGFDHRRRVGAGRFFGAEDVTRWHPQQLTDLLRHSPSMSLVPMEPFGFALRVRGSSTCSPSIFLDGRLLHRWELADLNAIVPPAQLEAMEVYTAQQAPAEFRARNEHCASIVVWTRAALAKDNGK